MRTWLVQLLNRLVYGQVGESRSWYMTVHHGDGAATPHDYWKTAIDTLAGTDAILTREWGSHAEAGDRANREYRLERTMVLLELDRWNGFTISGDRELLNPIVDRMQDRLGIR